MIFKNIGKIEKEEQMPLLSISNAIMNFTYTTNHFYFLRNIKTRYFISGIFTIIAT